MSWENLFMSYAYNNGADQQISLHICAVLVNIFVICFLVSLVMVDTI